MKDIVCLPTLAELKRHVHETLCRRDNLDPDQAPMQQALILRQDKPQARANVVIDYSDLTAPVVIAWR